MKEKKKVFVGLSGGVDSAVSAALLQERGYDVTAVFIKIAIEGYPCPAADDRREALRVAAHLQIPFLEIDLSKEYEQQILQYTLDSYGRGETPNPDTLCNKELKFGLLYDFCMKQGADYIATGHYARTKMVGDETHLYAGIDPEKDQSYFLWMVPQDRLAKTFFPVGDLHKSEVRKLAEKFGLPNALRKDSQGLCFLGTLSLEDLLKDKLQPKPGEVLDVKGRVIGHHEGAILYTIGQRHGFTVHARSNSEVPHFVINKNISNNTITVSPERKPETAVEHIALREQNWIGGVEEGAYQARFRYRQPLITGTLHTDKTISLDEPYFVPIGQSLVLYAQERCLGGGIIEKVYPMR